MTADLFAEVSTPVFVPELKAYRIATRQARTTVRLQEGQPLVIGGLIRREDLEHFENTDFGRPAFNREIIPLSL